jgi:hypothetical protein
MRIIDIQRGLMTALGAGIAGALVWVAATQIDDATTSGYWYVYGLIAAAGLVLALSQLAGGWTRGGMPVFSPGAFLIGFIPVAIVVGWIAVGLEPHGNTARSHILSWSGDLGIRDVVNDFREYVGVLVFGLGAILGFCFNTTGSRRRADVVVPPSGRRAADEPTMAERAEVNRPVARKRVVERDSEYAGTRAAVADGRRVEVRDDDA